jgi:hypothetical protein
MVVCKVSLNTRLQAAVMLTQETGGKPDLQLAEIYRSLAKIHEKTGNANKALSCHLQACSQYSALGVNSFDAADSSHKIGLSCAV